MPAAAATDPSTDVDKGSAADSGVADIYRDFGLFGTYAADCDRPSSPANPHVTVTEPDAGRVVELHDVGAGFDANRYRVEAARRVGKDRIEAIVIFMPDTPAQQRQLLSMVVGRGTRRTMFNRVEGGAIMVRHGVALAAGRKTPLLRKCG